MNKTKEILIDYFRTHESGETDKIVEYVLSVDSTIPYSSILGRLSEGAKDGEWKKVARSLYESVTYGSEGPVKEGEAAAPAAPVAPIVIDWGRDYTPEEETLLAINAAKAEGVKLDKTQQILLKQLQSGAIFTVMMTGDPGSGKSTTARGICHQLKLPVYAQNLALNTEEMHIIGGFVPDEVNGGFKWVDGQFTRAFRNGGAYLAEEPNYAKPGVLGILNTALDGAGELSLPNGEVLQRHKNFRFIGCMNVGLVGTQRMNPAFINRMQKLIKFKDMEKAQKIDIVSKESGYKNRDVIGRMIDIEVAIRKKIKDQQIDMASVSIRNVISWAKDVLETKNILESSWSTIIWPVAVDDDEASKEIYDDIIKSKMSGISA